MALDKHYHVWCFKCKACSTLLHGEYMGKDGQPYCEKCYQSHFGVKCSYCFRFISGKVRNNLNNNYDYKYLSNRALDIDCCGIHAILILCRCSKQAITTTFIRPALAAPSAVSPSATVRRCSSRERPSGTRAADPRQKMTQEETVNHCPTMSMVELPLSFRPMPLQESRNTQTWTDSPQLRKCRRLPMVSVLTFHQQHQTFRS